MEQVIVAKNAVEDGLAGGESHRKLVGHDEREALVI
jgi:hypothetical protein